MGGLVDLQLRALDNPSKLACIQPPQGGPIGFKRARLDEHQLMLVLSTLLVFFFWGEG